MSVRFGDGVVGRPDDELIVVGGEGGAFSVADVQVDLEGGVLIDVPR
jgi:hypothetical protein